jgi:hypothetical protein
MGSNVGFNGHVNSIVKYVLKQSKLFLFEATYKVFLYYDFGTKINCIPVNIASISLIYVIFVVSLI